MVNTQNYYLCQSECRFLHSNMKELKICGLWVLFRVKSLSGWDGRDSACIHQLFFISKSFMGEWQRESWWSWWRKLTKSDLEFTQRQVWVTPRSTRGRFFCLMRPKGSFFPHQTRCYTMLAPKYAHHHKYPPNIPQIPTWSMVVAASCCGGASQQQALESLY